jgi:S-formylglutathione hydrolase FrmB
MRLAWIALLACGVWSTIPTGNAHAFGSRSSRSALAGTLVDHTANHGGDYRIWSPSLGEHRDLYVYLPPGYDPHRAYPALIWLHGIAEDEGSFTPDGLRTIDAAIAAGRLPPLIVAMPDGTIGGQPRFGGAQPMFLNSRLGPFEDFVVEDVWGFLTQHYPICPERAQHIIGGYSGGGAAAYRIAIKRRDLFGIVIAGAPPLNVRWLDCHGRYFANFQPDCWGWRTDVRGHEVIGRFGGVITIRLGKLLFPLYGKGPDALEAMARENPIEMLDAYDVQPGELSMLVAYGGKDQFNIDAQVESFVYHARQRGLDVSVLRAAHGRHNLRLVERFYPQIVEWLAPQLVAPVEP